MYRLWNAVKSFFSGSGDDDIDTVRMIQGDDEELIAAVAKARATVDEFIDHFHNPEMEGAAFFVKQEFVEAEQSEHMWLMVDEVTETHFSGVVNNDPQFVTQVRIGERIKVAHEEIGDWMVSHGDDMTGGFTVEVLMRRGQKT